MIRLQTVAFLNQVNRSTGVLMDDFSQRWMYPFCHPCVFFFSRTTRFLLPPFVIQPKLRRFQVGLLPQTLSFFENPFFLINLCFPSLKKVILLDVLESILVFFVTDNKCVLNSLLNKMYHSPKSLMSLQKCQGMSPTSLLLPAWPYPFLPCGRLANGGPWPM